jgi:triacylglycerol lipase
MTEPTSWPGNHLAEMRWPLELGRLTIDPSFVPLGLPRGDARPVVLMPGFLAGDNSLAVLAAWLWRLGYRPHVCGFVANIDCSDRALARVERRVASLCGRTGRRVAVIGHSRGGHYARAVAARQPDRVSHAISLGADLHEMLGVSAATERMVRAVRTGLRVTRRARNGECFTAACPCGFGRAYRETFPESQVRLTSIYSKGDGVVRWQRCVVPYGDSVEVSGSHVGLIYNRQAYAAIARALATPEFAIAEPQVA